MRGDPEIIELLNEVLTAELTAINQYFIHAKMCENWGYERLGKHNRDESIGEMKDADKLIERILYLEGVPNLQRLGTVMVGEDAHADWIETQQHLVATIGVENYLAQQIGTA